jgi:hypothetical protein
MNANTIDREIDTYLNNLCRIWVAEYLNAGAADDRMNRELLTAFSGPKPPSTGRWVALARQIRQTFMTRGWTTVVDGLASQDFGELGDRKHPIARLLDFRNMVDHGGLIASEEDALEHRRLLSGIVEKIPALHAQPILFRLDDGRILDANDPGRPAPAVPVSLDVMSLQPFILGRDGRTILPLYPLYYMASESEGYKLLPVDTKRTKKRHSIPQLFEQTVLRTWYERYLAESNGHLSFDEKIVNRATSPMPSDVLEAVNAVLSAGHNLVVVEAYPGCGKVTVLKHLGDPSVANHYAAVCLWMVEPGDLGQSGQTFTNFLLRQVEGCLGMTDKSLGLAGADWQAAIERGKQALSQEGKQLLVGIEDLHAGCVPLGKESVSVYDVYRVLATGPIAVVATAHPGRAPKRLVFDSLVSISVPAEADIARDWLAQAVAELCPPSHPMRLRVLKALVKNTEPMDLFGLCDALETNGDKVFEPAVERALWDLRPLLIVDVVGSVKRWGPFTSALRQIPMLGGGQ